ncbi:MAG: DUF4244 domain-containing protein [Acidimicrobiia bacterium]
MTRIVVILHVLALQARHRLPDRLARDDGQSTAEYALVLLGAATVAGLLIAWAARSGRIGDLLDAVLDQVVTKIG